MRLQSISSLAGLLLLLSVSAYSDTSPFSNVHILYSANVSGELEPCGCRSNPTGGVQRRWNWEAQTIGANEPVVRIDSGDLLFQSTPVPPALESQWTTQAQALVEAYNQLRIDVMTPGELDFANGVKAFLDLKKQARFAIVSANLEWVKEKKLLLDSFVVVEKGGKKIGITGVYGENLPIPSELKILPVEESLKKVINELQKKKVDAIFLLSHLGYEQDVKIAESFDSLYAIFGAHTQSFITEPKKHGKVWIFHTSFRGQHVGHLYKGQHSLVAMEEKYDSAATKQNPLDTLILNTKTKINSLNTSLDQELKKTSIAAQGSVEFQTFAQCATCHAPQYEFHKKTPHFRAFDTLVKKKQGANLDCLKCHTVGLHEEKGYALVKDLAHNAKGERISAEKLAAKLPKLPAEKLSEYSKTYLNVQCESCHQAGGEHPFGPTAIQKKVAPQTCLQCHTQSQAPEWYSKDGKPNLPLIEAKLKTMSCPK